jgi:hypothetical protein
MAIKERKKQMASAFQALYADIAAQTAFTGSNGRGTPFTLRYRFL